MANVVLNDITSGYNLSKINDNFEVIEAALNEDRLQLTDGGNVMSQDLDMNSNSILNALSLSVQYITLNGQQLAPSEVVISDAVTQSVLGSNSGAGMVGFKRTAIGAISRTAQSKLDEFAHVADFGAVGDGVTDDSAAIQAAINDLAAKGGGELRFGPLNYAVGSTLLISTNNIFLRGCGSNNPHDAGSGAIFSTNLLWIGGPSVSVVNYETPKSISNSKRSGGGVYGIQVDCAGVAAYGYRVCSWDRHKIEECYVKSPTVAAFKLTCWSTTELAEAADTQYCIIERCAFNLTANAASASATGILLTAEAPTTSTADTSLCRVVDCVGQVKNGVGLYIQCADNNYIENVRGFVVGTGWTYVLDGTYSNVFVGCPIGSKTRMLGTASGSPINCTMNTFICCDDANSTGSPVADAGCTYQIHGTKYGWQGLISGPAAFGTSRVAAQTQQANISTETLRVSSSSSDHIRLTDGVNEWGISIDSVTGNLRIVRVTSNGVVSFGTTVNLGNFTTHADAAITGYITINDAGGTPRKLAVIA